MEARSLLLFFVVYNGMVAALCVVVVMRCWRQRRDEFEDRVWEWIQWLLKIQRDPNRWNTQKPHARKNQSFAWENMKFWR